MNAPREMSVGDTTYRIEVEPRGEAWHAHARRADSGERFGLETTGPSEDEAVSRLVQWLEWQRAHTTALEALQQAERAYHRAVAGEAFGAAAPAAGAESRASLDAVDVARQQLDDVRARRPQT